MAEIVEAEAIVVRELFIQALPYLKYLGAALGVVMGVLAIAALVLYFTAAQGDAGKFHKLVEEGTTESKNLLLTPFRSSGGQGQNSRRSDSPSPSNRSSARSRTSVYSEASPGWSADAPGWTRSTIRNLNMDLAEEDSIRRSASRKMSPPGSPSRPSFYKGPRRFRVFDCANLVACAACLLAWACCISFLLLLFPPDETTVKLLRESPLIAPLLFMLQ